MPVVSAAEKSSRTFFTTRHEIPFARSLLPQTSEKSGDRVGTIARMSRFSRSAAHWHLRSRVSALEDSLWNEGGNHVIRHVDHVAHSEIHRHTRDDVGLLARPA